MKIDEIIVLVVCLEIAIAITISQVSRVMDQYKNYSYIPVHFYFDENYNWYYVVGFILIGLEYCFYPYSADAGNLFAAIFLPAMVFIFAIFGKRIDKISDNLDEEIRSQKKFSEHVHRLSKKK